MTTGGTGKGEKTGEAYLAPTGEGFREWEWAEVDV